MATTSLQGNRPAPLHTSKSFTRYEPRQIHSPGRSRASTLSHEVRNLPIYESPDTHEQPQRHLGDVFEKPNIEETPDSPASVMSRAGTENLPDDFDELPVELLSWTDRFMTELQSAKIYPTPLSIDDLSQLFQDFYAKAEARISTHIQSLATRQKRDTSPAPSIGSRSSKSNTKLQPQVSKDSLRRSDISGGHQMLTAGDLAERRKNRRLLEYKRIVLEEAVERRVCEGLYGKLWRHRSTLDEVRDEKLRSKTASLALVGINLKDLGVDMNSAKGSDVSPADLAVEIEERIRKAKDGLAMMNGPHDPAGKLQHLISTHQNIVDLLTKIRQSSSSADEILPTLIYTLITSPPEGLNIISNLNFIQRFRSSGKIDGEAAYCLTNLEAAVSFLETVDLASLRSEEAIDNSKIGTVDPPTPGLEKSNPLSPTLARPSSPATTHITVVPEGDSHPLQSPSFDTDMRPPLPKGHHRRSSSFFQSFNVAGGSVRATADQSIRNIGETLDTSFSFLFGRLREQQAQNESDNPTSPIVVPKTLDEARKLVSPKPLLDDDGSVSENSSYFENDTTPSAATDVSKREDPLFGLFGIRMPAPARDHSADSALSSASSSARSGRKVSGSNPVLDLKPPLAQTQPSISPPIPSPALESMRAFGSSLNPLNRLRGFGRSTSVPLPPAEVTGKELMATTSSDSVPRVGTISPSPEPEVAKQEEFPLIKERERIKVDPPISRFIEIEDAGQLKLAEVQSLLNDYRRLAAVIQGQGLC